MTLQVFKKMAERHCATQSAGEVSVLDASHPDPRLRGRGNPGTHDVALIGRCIARLLNYTESNDYCWTPTRSNAPSAYFVTDQKC